MKQLLTLLLAVVLSLSLVACGKNSEPPADRPQTAITQMEDNLAATQNCVAVLRVQINPAFDLYLDENDRVLAVDAVNDDAKQILANTNVVGENGVDAIGRLWGEAASRGFAGSGTIYVTPVYASDNTSAQALVNDLPEALAHLSVSIELDEDGIIEVTSTNQGDSNNTLVNTSQVEKDTEGNIFTRHFDESGRLVREVTEFTNGDRQDMTFDKGGLPLTIVIDYANGDHYEATLLNGIHVTSTRTLANGAQSQTTYDANGIAVLTTGTAADGGQIEELYYSNGEIKQHTIRYADGSYNIQTYSENGLKLTQESAYVNGAGALIGSKFLYDASGNVTEYYGQDNFGRPVHKIYNSDGTSVTYRTETDGAVTTIYYDSNGNEIHP